MGARVSLPDDKYDEKFIELSDDTEEEVTPENVIIPESQIAGMWSFSRDNEWVSKFPTCNKNATNISPLNIDTSKVSPCNALCRLSINYKPSTCSISMVNNIPTVTFSPNSIIKFKDDFYFLRKMTLHYTSMHTINNSYSDLEILLYHNRNPINDNDGGVIISILLNKGEDYGTANEFMNEFINQMPANEMPIEQDIDVSSTWCPKQLFPESSKSFFYYEGALPYPPCTLKWTYIIFELSVPISMNIIDTVKYIVGPGNKNIRPIQRTPPNIFIYYNANTYFDNSQDISDSTINSIISPQTTLPVVNALGSTYLEKTENNVNFAKGKSILRSVVKAIITYF